MSSPRKPPASHADAHTSMQRVKLQPVATTASRIDVQKLVPDLCNPAIPRVKLRDADGLPDIERVLAPVDPIERNKQITAGYQRFASKLQQILDHGFVSAVTSATSPNWFAIGAYASNAAGHGLVAIEKARGILDRFDILTTEQLLFAAGLSSGDAARYAKVVDAAAWLGPFREVVPVIVALSQMGPRADLVTMLDLRLMFDQAQRLRALWGEASSGDPRARLRALLATLENTLAEGNRAIFEDMASAARDFLRARKSQPTFDVRAVALSLAGAWAGEEHAAVVSRRGRRVYEVMLRHAQAGGVPDALGDVFDDIGPAQSRALQIAAFLLYETSRHASDAAMRDRCIQAGNNLLAWREQLDILQPVFERTHPGEVSRRRLMEAVTPFMAIPIGSMTWRLGEYARENTMPVVGSLVGAVLGRDGTPFSAPAAEYNWAKLEDRWRAIQNVFRKAYDAPEAMWTGMPEPDPRRSRTPGVP